MAEKRKTGNGGDVTSGMSGGGGDYDEDDAAEFADSVGYAPPQYVAPDNDTQLRFDIFQMLLPQYPDLPKLPKAIADIERVIQGRRPRVVGADE